MLARLAAAVSRFAAPEFLSFLNSSEDETRRTRHADPRPGPLRRVAARRRRHLSGLRRPLVIPPSHAHVRLRVLLAAAFVVAALAASPAKAQRVDPSLPPLADVSIVTKYDVAEQGWTLIVENNTVGAHPARAVHSVTVRIVVEQPTGPDETIIRTIRDLPAESRTAIDVDWPVVLYDPSRPARLPLRMYAEITETVPAEPLGFQFNNASDSWIMVGRGGQAKFYTDGDAGVVIDDISDRLPEARGATTFNVRAFNVPGENYGGHSPSNIHDQLRVQVRISLSQGLAFAGTTQAPSGTMFNRNTGIWDVGDQEAGPDAALTLPVAVNLTTESLDDLPLEQRCLTAEVVRAVPWFEFVRRKRQNDTFTLCLGEAKVLVTGGNFTLVDFYPCIGVTSGPCTIDDTLELLATVDRRFAASETIVVHALDVPPNFGEYLQPESFTVHVPDPRGRRTKFGSVIWSTVDVMDLKDSQTKLTSNWSIRESVTVTAPGGGDAPGRWLWTSTDDSDRNNYDILDAVDSTPVTEPFLDLSSIGTDPQYYVLDAKVDFWELGTYKALLGITGRLSGATYSDNATYTFHVGPAAELEVRDAGASPEVARGQRAYAIMAVNNGPDAAPVVEVTLTGVPQGAQASPSEGRYVESTCQNGLCSGHWIIDDLGIPDVRRSTGLAEGPTLTLVTDAAAGPVTATIKSTRDYCVRIKTADTDPGNDLECVGSLPAGYTEHNQPLLRPQGR